MIKRLWKRRKAKHSQMVENKKLTLDYNIPNPVKEINKKINEVENMKIKADKIIKISDGLHSGTITNIEYREEPYKYTDITILEKENNVELRCGVPTKISEISSLGNILQNFGVKIEPNKEYEPEKILLKKEVTFVTVNEKTERGTFARVQPQSIKPKDI